MPKGVFARWGGGWYNEMVERVTRGKEKAVEKEAKRRGPMRVLLEWLTSFSVALLLALVITQVLIVNAQVPSSSMAWWWMGSLGR